MSIARRHITRLVIVLLIAAFQASSGVVAASARDSLYIGDGADNTVKQFDATTGAYLGKFITPGAQVQGPQGILHLSNGNFLVSNQQVSTPINGEIDQYASTGKSLGPLVPNTDQNAPFAPQAIILSPDKSTLYVADLGRGDVRGGQTLQRHLGPGHPPGSRLQQLHQQRDHEPDRRVPSSRAGL